MTNVVTFLPRFDPVEWVMQADAAGLIMYFNPAGKLTPHIAPRHDRDQIIGLARLADATPNGWDTIAEGAARSALRRGYCSVEAF